MTPPKKAKRSKKKAKAGKGRRPLKTRRGRAATEATMTSTAAVASVIVRRELKGDCILSAELNSRDLSWVNHVARATVPEGKSNLLEWWVIGPPSSAYRIWIDKPEGTGCDNGAVLDKEEKDDGQCEFQT